MLLFCYNMAQVIKALEGTTIYQPFKEGLRTTAGVTYKNTDAIDYLSNQEYRKRYADYRNMNDAQRAAFYSAVDAYTNDIKNGKIDFTMNGLSNPDNLDQPTYTLVNDYFIRGLNGNRIVLYDESNKDLYKPNLKKIIATNVFDNEDLTDSALLDAWNALDAPDPKTGIRGITNRRKKYAEALRMEADKLENDSKYRNIYRYTGWQDNIDAYKKTANYLRAHAAEIENLDDIKAESWYQNAAMSNLTPQDVRNLFDLSSPLKRELDEKKAKQNQQDNSTANNGTNAEGLPDGYSYVDPLSTQDIEIVLGGKKYTINDSWQNIDNEAVKKNVETILGVYGRQQIKDNWTFWRGQKGYLENLTGLFEGRESPDFMGIYSVTNSAIGHAGKKFLIRTQKHAYPVEVTLVMNNDGTYIAKDKSGNSYNLGRYNPNKWNTASRTLDDTNDLGKPFKFDINLLNSSALAVRQYLLDTVASINPNTYPPLIWANMLMQLSYYFDQKAPNGSLTLQLPNNGSIFELDGYRGTNKAVKSFTWKQGNYGIKFNFNKNGTWIIRKSKTGRQTRCLNPYAISSIEIIRPKRKLGGRITRLQYGGISDMVNFQKQYGTAYEYTVGYPEQTKPKDDNTTHYQDLSKKQKLASDKDFTVADGIRVAAAGTDLLSSMLMFVPGTQIAGAAGTGISVGGYILSDIIDGIQGRQSAGDIILNNALMIGTMAVPMFINPQRAKALGMGQKAQRAAHAFSKWFGWAVAAGMIANEETRKSLENTITKISNLELTKLNSQDATNIAFMVRMAGGVKEGFKAKKAQKAIEQSKVDNASAYVDYSYKEGENVVQGEPILVTKDTNLSIKSLKDQILTKLNEGRTDETKLKAEDINIAEADKKWYQGLGDTGKTYIKKFLNKYKKNKETTQETKSDPQAAIRLELGEASEMSPLYTRIFEKTAIENGKPIKQNTAIGKFIRKTLGFDNFDVFFSDYSTVKNYRLSKLRRLIDNYYKPLDALREQGKRFYEIIKQEGVPEETINQQLAKAMNEYGFLENDPAVIDYARRLASYYETDLSKYDNLQLAQMAFDKEVQLANAKGTTPINPNEHADSQLNTHKLDYVNETDVTPEFLQEAYEMFLREKQTQPAEGGTASLLHQLLNAEKPATEDNRRQLVNKVFSSFNSENIIPIQISQEQMIKMLRQTNAVHLALSSKTTTLSGPTITKALKQLVSQNKITQEQADRLQENGGIDKLAKIIEERYHNAEKPKPQNQANARVINKNQKNNKIDVSKNLEELKNKIKEEAKNVQGKSINERLNSVLNKLKSEGVIDDNDYQVLHSKHWNSLRKLVPKHYEGGSLDFVNKVLKLQEGKKIRGIKWTSGNQNWGSEVGPRAWNYIFDLIAGGNNSLLSYEKGSLYDLGNRYVPLRTEYDNNYAKEDYSLQSDDVNNYQKDYYDILPGYQTRVLGDLYNKGRYSKNGQQITGQLPEDNNIYRTNGMAAGTADLMGLGNINYLNTEDISKLLEIAKSKWPGGQVYYDTTTGTIYPLAEGQTPKEGSALLSEFNGATENTQTTATSPKTESDWKAEHRRLFADLYDKDGKLLNPQPGLDKVEGAPINWLRLASIFGTNWANIKALEALKAESYKQISPHGVSRIFRDLSKVEEADREYAPYMGRHISSDIREDEAFMQNVLSAHHKARAQGYDLNRATFKESVKEDQEARWRDTTNAYNTYNENIKNQTSIDNLNRQYKAQQIITNANNWKNFIDTLTAEMAQDQKIKNNHNLQAKAARYQDDYNSAVITKRQAVYNQILNNLKGDQKALEDFKKDYPDATTPFEESKYTDPHYRNWLNEYEEVQRNNYYTNLEQLFNASWDTRRFWHDIIYPYYKKDWSGGPDPQKEKERLEQYKKSGGKIHMAKKGGASVNWVRVENARMINKSIQNDIKHTYESLKEANKEMQRNIRAMAPLIRQLSKQDTVKLK